MAQTDPWQNKLTKPQLWKRILSFGTLREPSNKPMNFKEKLSKFSTAIIAPVTILSFAGIFLGVGSTVEQYQRAEGVLIFARILTAIGNVVFYLLPLMFAMAIAAAFSNNSGTAVLTAVIMYVALLMLSGAQFLEKTIDGRVYWSWFGAINFEQVQRADLITNVLGVKTLDTSVLGGFLIGGLAVYIHNKFKNTKLPTVLAMFQGERMPPIMSIVIAIPLSFIVALVWPWVSLGFVKFGQVSGRLPGGLDSFLFGFFDRLLLPAGLHHMFYAPLLYTSAGGTVLPTYTFAYDVTIGNQVFASGTPLYQIDASIFKPAVTIADTMPDVPGLQAGVADLAKFSPIYGDRTIFLNVNGTAMQFSWFETLRDGNANAGIHLGRFVAGQPVFIMFWLPAAGAAMVMMAPKPKRKAAFGVVFSACLSAFLTGITEPIQYTFLFVAPLLYWGFHTVMVGVAFLVMNVSGVYFGGTGGSIIDLAIFGFVPQGVGQNANIWWVIVVGVAGMPIYFFVFYFAIKKWNLKTPGRDDGEFKLVTKQEYAASKKGHDPLLQKAISAFNGLGGTANIEAITNCASRLRVVVKDPSLVDYEMIAQSKPFGIVGKGTTSQQLVYGPDVVIIAKYANELLEGKRTANGDQKAQPVK